MKHLALAIAIVLSIAGYSQKGKSITTADSLDLGGTRVGGISASSSLGTSDKVIPTQKAVKGYVDNSFNNNRLRNSKATGDTLMTAVGADGVLKTITVIGTSVTKSVTDTSITYTIGDGTSGALLTGTKFTAPIGMTPFGDTGPTTTLLTTANSIVAVKFYLPYRMVVNTIGAYVSTPAASSTMSLGIYDVSGNRVINSGAIVSTTTGVKTAAVGGIELLPGFYWATYSFSSTAVKIAGWSNQGYTGLDQDLDVYGLSSNTVSAGNMPATLGTISNYSGDGGFVILK